MLTEETEAEDSAWMQRTCFYPVSNTASGIPTTFQGQEIPPADKESGF